MLTGQLSVSVSGFCLLLHHIQFVMLLDVSIVIFVSFSQHSLQFKGVFLIVSSDKEIVTHEGYFVPDSSGQQVARGDVARFMLSLLGTSTWLKKGVAMITK